VVAWKRPFDNLTVGGCTVCKPRRSRALKERDMSAKNYARLAAVVFAIMALLQLGRAVAGVAGDGRRL
jgi:hypothetical protein